MVARARRGRLPPWWLIVVAMVAGCAGPPVRQTENRPPPVPREVVSVRDPEKIADTVWYAFSLVDRHYRFGGRNPDSGLDCSGMISHIYERMAGIRLPHNAARIAALTRPIPESALEAGDLVFFEIDGQRYAHMGLYAGGRRFVHAPSSRGKYIRIDRLDDEYWARRLSASHSLRPDRLLGYDTRAEPRP